MNTAIQDAANLGWKLAFAAAWPHGAVLVDSYKRERRPVAMQVLGMSHLAFWGEAATGAFCRRCAAGWHRWPPRLRPWPWRTAGQVPTLNALDKSSIAYYSLHYRP